MGEAIAQRAIIKADILRLAALQRRIDRGEKLNDAGKFVQLKERLEGKFAMIEDMTRQGALASYESTLMRAGGFNSAGAPLKQ